MSEYMPERMSDRMSEKIYILYIHRYMPYILSDGMSETFRNYVRLCASGWGSPEVK